MRGKKLTYEMKKMLVAKGYDPSDWLYQKNTLTELQICKKESHKEIVVINKEI